MNRPDTLYSAALFLHIVGALLLFATLTLEGIGLRLVRRAATAAQVRESAGIAGLARMVGPASAPTILLPGVYLAATTWGSEPWILVGFAAWVTVGVLGAVNGVRLGAIGRAAESGPLTPDLAARAADPLLLASWRVRVAIVLGVVLLMSVKPPLSGSLVAIMAAAAAGVVASVPSWLRAAAVAEEGISA